MGDRRPRRGKRDVSHKIVPYVSYFSGKRVVIGQAIISARSFPEHLIQLSPDGEEEIRTRQVNENERSVLVNECGHHCGAQKIGDKLYVDHCDCPDCHNTRKEDA